MKETYTLLTAALVALVSCGGPMVDYKDWQALQTEQVRVDNVKFRPAEKECCLKDVGCPNTILRDGRGAACTYMARPLRYLALNLYNSDREQAKALFAEELPYRLLAYQFTYEGDRGIAASQIQTIYTMLKDEPNASTWYYRACTHSATFCKSESEAQASRAAATKRDTEAVRRRETADAERDEQLRQGVASLGSGLQAGYQQRLANEEQKKRDAAAAKVRADNDRMAASGAAQQGGGASGGGGGYTSGGGGSRSHSPSDYHHTAGKDRLYCGGSSFAPEPGDCKVIVAKCGSRDTCLIHSVHCCPNTRPYWYGGGCYAHSYDSCETDQGPVADSGPCCEMR